MRLAIISRGRSTRMRWDAVVAILLTAASFGSLSTRATQLAAASRQLQAHASSAAPEHITYLTIAVPHSQNAPLVRRAQRAAPTSTEPGVLGTSKRSPDAPASPVASADSAAPIGTAVATPASSPSTRSLVFIAPSALTRAPIEGHGLPLTFRYLPPTQEEKDSAARAFALEATLARNEGRPVRIPMAAGGGLAFPLFSRGPSRAQRVKDSIIYSQNLDMLHRLQERIRAKQDSARTADSSKPGSKPPTA